MGRRPVAKVEDFPPVAAVHQQRRQKSGAKENIVDADARHRPLIYFYSPFFYGWGCIHLFCFARLETVECRRVRNDDSSTSRASSCSASSQVNRQKDE